MSRQRRICGRQYIQMGAWWRERGEFSGFRNQDERKKGECGRIVINSELFYLGGIRGINGGFGFWIRHLFAPFQHGSRGFLYVNVFVRLSIYLSLCVCVCVCVCVRVSLYSRRLRVSVPAGLWPYLPASQPAIVCVLMCDLVPPTYWSSSKHYKLIRHNRQKDRKWGRVVGRRGGEGRRNWGWGGGASKGIECVCVCLCV